MLVPVNDQHVHSTALRNGTDPSVQCPGKDRLWKKHPDSNPCGSLVGGLTRRKAASPASIAGGRGGWRGAVVALRGHAPTGSSGPASCPVLCRCSGRRDQGASASLSPPAGLQLLLAPGPPWQPPGPEPLACSERCFLLFQERLPSFAICSLAWLSAQTPKSLWPPRPSLSLC